MASMTNTETPTTDPKKRLTQTPEGREQLWENVKEAFNHFKENKIGSGFVKSIDIGKSLTRKIMQGTGVYFGIDILSNPNLKPWQKIIPTIGLFVAGLVTVPLSIIGIFIAALAFPPFVIVGATAGIIQNALILYRDVIERNNIKKEMVKTTPLIKSIFRLKKVSISEKQDILDFTFKQQGDIYKALYDLRKDLITSTASKALKEEKINQINSLIESFNKGEISPIQLAKFSTIDSNIIFNANISATVELIKKHQDTKFKIDHGDIILPKSLKKQIDYYQATQNKIYSQDLPSDLKEQLIEMVEGKKIDTNERRLMYARIGNHYVNETSQSQIAAQNLSIDRQISKIFPDQKEMIQQYYQGPIIIDRLLSTLKSTNPNQEFITDINAFQKQLQIGTEKKDSDHILKKWEEFSEKHDQNSSETMLEIKSHLTLLKENENQFSALFPKEAPSEATPSKIKRDKKLEDITDLKRLIEAQRISLLFASNLQFNSPNVKSDYGKNNLTQGWGEKIQNKFSANDGEESFSKKLKNDLIIKLFGEKSLEKREAHTKIRKEFKDAQKELQNDFKNRYHSTFEVIEKKERLDYLEKAIPRRVANIGMGLVVATCGVLSSIVLPVVATPGAPAYLAVAGIIGTISAAFSVGVMGNSIALTVQANKVKEKSHKEKENIVLGAGPSPEANKQLLEKIHQAENKNANQKNKQLKREKKKLANLADKNPGDQKNTSLVFGFKDRIAQALKKENKSDDGPSSSRKNSPK